MLYPTYINKKEQLVALIRGRPHRVEERKCLSCGGLLHVRLSELRRDPETTGKYCSRACVDMTRRVAKNCKICGKMFLVLHSRKDRYSTCSKRCREMYRKRRAVIRHRHNGFAKVQ